MNFINKVNGIDMQCRRLTRDEREVLLPVYERALVRFVEWLQTESGWDPDDCANHKLSKCIGSRTSFDGVMDRLNGIDVFGYHSGYGSPEDWVLDAIRDGARAQYWYRFEKEW